jgi:hypothetical protein
MAGKGVLLSLISSPNRGFSTFSLLVRSTTAPIADVSSIISSLRGKLALDTSAENVVKVKTSVILSAG